MIVGLSGWARSGKDSVGRFLVERHGFERIAFADRVRDLAMQQDPYVQLSVDGDITSGMFCRLSALVNTHGWDYAKSHDDVRRLLVSTGEGVRAVLGEDSWILAAFGSLDPARDYVITDVRKRAEAQAIWEHSGTLWRVVRPSASPLNGLDSELDSYTFDTTINNGGSLSDLQEIVATHLAISRPLAENKEAI